PTHRQIHLIKPKVDGQAISVHTIASDSVGSLIVAAGPPQSGMLTPVKSSTGFVLKLDPAGEELQRWELDFIPSALAVAGDDSIYVGGSGYLTHLGLDGSIADKIDSPHIGDRKTFAKRTLKAQQRLMASFAVSEEALKPLRDMVERLEKKDEDERSRIEQAQLDAIKRQLEQMEALVKANDSKDEASEEEEEFTIPDDPMTQYRLESAKAVTSMAVAEDWLFVCASDPSSRGYSVWKLSRNLADAEPEKILSDLRGCCGQMDIQCTDTELITSENGAFAVGFYDFEGDSIRKFGKQDRSSREGFGSCCNPMNTQVLSDGSILTAESSIGHLKRFDKDGNFLGYVGKASIGGGCKHCAIGHNRDQDLYYMMYQDKNAICVLGCIEDHPITETELLLAKRQQDFLQECAGVWEVQADAKPKNMITAALDTLFDRDEEDLEATMTIQAPFTKWTITKDGSVTIDEGTYAQFVEDGTLEGLPSEPGDSPESMRIAIAEDQVRMIEAIVAIQDDEMTVNLEQMGQSLVFHRIKIDPSASESSCEEPCGDTGCEKDASSTALVEASAEEVAEEFNVLLAEAMEEDVKFDTSFYEVDPMLMDSMPVVKVEYKLLSIKDLGAEREKTLNELGADGWDYCGNLGSELMFKRAIGLVDSDSLE
ncbi:MAG: hypothetical protein AAGD07_06365, partial [Planctomycetota bacterium]